MPDFTTFVCNTLGERGLSITSALAQVAPVAPGGGGGAPAPAPAGGSPAPSSGGGGGAGGGAMQLLFPILIFVAFYFFLIRPQQKKQKELESKLKKGDRVFTNAGIIGTIIELGDKRVTLEVAKGVRMEFLRTAIGGIDEGDPKADPKKTESKDATEKRA